MKLKAVFAATAAAVVIFLGGALSGWMLHAHGERTASAFGVGRLLNDEANLLKAVYYSSADKETKLIALKHYSNFLEEAGNAVVPFVGEKAYKTDIALTYTRIGLVLSELNRNQESEEYFKRAVALRPDSSVEELIRIVHAMDQAR